MKPVLTRQELLERYVESVKALLPPDKMDDIAAEINSNLQSQMEDRALALGRELRPEELSAILKRHGHPNVVASRYRDRPGQVLIGPELFPFYWSTLRAILGVWVLLRVIGAIGALLASRETAAAGSILLYLSRDIMVVGFLIGAGVTAVFAVWEYLALPFPYSERWKPEHLPPVSQPRITPTRPTVKITRAVVGLFFLAMALFWPAMFWVWNRNGIFSPSATVYAMRLPLLLLASLWISQVWLNEWQPFLRVAVNTAGLLLALVLLGQGDLLVAGPNMNPAQGASLETLNRFFAGVLVVSCISSGLQCVRELRRFIKANGRRMAADRQTAGSAS